MVQNFGSPLAQVWQLSLVIRRLDVGESLFSFPGVTLIYIESTFLHVASVGFVVGFK